MDEPTVPMGEPELWRASDYRQGLAGDGGPVNPRLRGVSAALYRDLAGDAPGAAPPDLLAVLAACLRHGCAATLQLDWAGRVLPLTVFPREGLAHLPLGRAVVEALPWAGLRLIEAEPAALRPPERPGSPPGPPPAPRQRPAGRPLTGPLGPDLLPLNPLDLDFELHLASPDPVPAAAEPVPLPAAASSACHPLQHLAWALALHGAHDGLLPGIAGPALYRSTPDLQLPPEQWRRWGETVLRLREQPVSVETLAAWPGLDAPQARRLLNALYLQSGLIVSRSPLALTWSAWFGALLGPGPER